MNLFSYKGLFPQKLPNRVRLNDGRTITSLEDLSIQELNDIGFTGPFSIPEYDSDIEDLIWDGNSFRVLKKSEKSVEISLENYKLFLDIFRDTSFFKKIETFSVSDSKINQFLEKFLDLVIEGSVGNIINPQIFLQQEIYKIFIFIEFDDIEKQEFQKILNESNLNSLFHIPTQEFLNSHFYREDVDAILPIEEVEQTD